MNTAINRFEIPAEKMERAKKFYENVLKIELTQRDFENGLKMAIFPKNDNGVSGPFANIKTFIH